MTNSEAQIATLEAEFPSLSGIAFSTARSEALASELSVVEVVDGVVCEVFPDGTRLENKRINLPTPVVPGTKIAIRWTGMFPECGCLRGRMVLERVR